VGGKVRSFETHPANFFDTSSWMLAFPSSDNGRALPHPPADRALEFPPRSELSGRFFSAFEDFSGLSLPSFCKDEFEFVYFLRGVLESDAIANSLHLWVAQIFQCGVLRVPRPPVHKETTPFSLPSFRIGTYADQAFKLVQGDGTMFSISVQDPVQVWRFSMHISAIIAHADCVTLFDHEGSRLLHTTNGGDLFKETTLDFRVSRIFDCTDLIAIFTNTNDIVVMRPPNIISQFRMKIERAISVYASSEYNRIVVGTDTGKILFYALCSAKLVAGAAVEGWIPQRILVTAGFGFVVVAGFGRIAVFTINGTKIREREFAGTIEKWSAFSNRRGFDFILLATDDGRVSVVEAFTLTESQTGFQSRPVAAVLAYDEQCEWFAAATQNSGQFIPWNAVETLPRFD
jgi:hypothetical protein